MIRVEELRINNIVGLKQANIDYKGGKIEAAIQAVLFPCSVIRVFENNVTCKVKDKYLVCTSEQVSPIPLTDKWLADFGFVNNGDEDDSAWDHKEESLFSVCEGSIFTPILWVHIWDGAFTSAPCEYVHQLQNLFFALTGKELIINK